MNTTYKINATLPFCLLLLLATFFASGRQAQAQENRDYDSLLQLFAEWREFESPPLLDGAPDYTADQFARRRSEFDELRQQLNEFQIEDWPVPQQVDWHLVWAEMNGYDFNERVLQPWARDPAFYDTVWMQRSDVPAHEGPTNHAVIEVWEYDFPLSAAAETRLLTQLRAIPPLMHQARRNLTGNARDLWITGIRDVRAQESKLASLAGMAGVSSSRELMAAIEESRKATRDLVAWLDAEASSKTGPSGIGRENASPRCEDGVDRRDGHQGLCEGERIPRLGHLRHMWFRAHTRSLAAERSDRRVRSATKL
jgi:hypothetical protein